MRDCALRIKYNFECHTTYSLIKLLAFELIYLCQSYVLCNTCDEVFGSEFEHENLKFTDYLNILTRLSFTQIMTKIDLQCNIYTNL